MSVAGPNGLKYIFVDHTLFVNNGHITIQGVAVQMLNLILVCCCCKFE